MSNRGLVMPADGRRMISTVVGIALVAAGAILRFAVPATFIYGLNAHVVGVFVMLAGIVGLLLSLLVWGPLDRRRNTRTSRRRGARRSRDRESALRESEHRRRTVSYDSMPPLGSDQSPSVFHLAGC